MTGYLTTMERRVMAIVAGKIPNEEQIADRMAIQDVLYSHSRGLDRRDSVTISAAYWPEAEVDYGSYKGHAHTFAELVVAALASQYELTRHCLGNTLIEFAGDNALSESCVQASHLLLGATEEMLFYGRYLDRLEKRGCHWKILHRQVVMDWSNRIPVCDERASEGFTALAKGSYLGADPLYTFLATK
jgi:hypothetical protein